MLSQWHSCPHEVLQGCFSEQLDYSDNAAAACACKPWRETFITCASRASTLLYGGMRTDASPYYLRQHPHLTSLTLINLPIWDNARSWLHVAHHDAVKHHSIALPTWPDIFGAVSATCEQLTLDRFLPEPNHTLALPGSILHKTFSQFSLLQHLTLNEDPGKVIDIEALSGLLGLRVLEVCSQARFNMVKLAGSLSVLPCSITRLQLQSCTASTNRLMLPVVDLVHMQSLRDLDLDAADVYLGHAALARLPLLTRLHLPNTHNRSFSVHHEILPLTRLHALYLRHAVYPALSLEKLLFRLSNLQELDVLECSRNIITPAGCQHLRLLSISIEADMLTTMYESCFRYCALRAQISDLVSKSCCRMVCRYPRSHMLDLVNPKLFYAITHLVLIEALMWPAFFRLNEVDLPLLRVLDVRYPSSSSLMLESDKGTVIVSPQLKLAELYVMDSRNSSFDLAKCTSLRSIGVTHSHIGGPTSLQYASHPS